MKTKEEILKDLADPIREAVLSAITPIISNAMTMYSDQQNKELREIINNVLNKTESDKDVIIIEQGFTLQRLMKELDEVKTSHYQKLDAQLVEDVERLTEENKELREDRPFQFSPTNSEREWQVKIVNDYIHPNQEDWQKMNAVCNSLIEIQRLTKELGELKLKLSGKTFFNPFEQENTRLRELLDKTMPHVQTCEGSDSKLLTEISNALNHKP